MLTLNLYSTWGANDCEEPLTSNGHQFNKTCHRKNVLASSNRARSSHIIWSLKRYKLKGGPSRHVSKATTCWDPPQSWIKYYHIWKPPTPYDVKLISIEWKTTLIKLCFRYCHVQWRGSSCLGRFLVFIFIWYQCIMYVNVQILKDSPRFV